jgi:hypothetical protein
MMASMVELSAEKRGMILNISEGGMAVFSAEDLDENYFRNIRFHAPESEEWIETGGEIAWISKSKKRAGIRFNDLTEGARNRLREGISIAAMRSRGSSLNAGWQSIESSDDAASGKYEVPPQSPETALEQTGGMVAGGGEEKLAAMPAPLTASDLAGATTSDSAGRAASDSAVHERFDWVGPAAFDSVVRAAADLVGADASESVQGREHAGLENVAADEDSRRTHLESNEREPAMDFPLAGSSPRVETNAQALLSGEAKKDARTQLMELPLPEEARQEIRERVHQEILARTRQEKSEGARQEIFGRTHQEVAERTHREIPEWASGDVRSVQLPIQKIAPARILPPNALSHEVAKQSPYAQGRTWTQYNMGYHNWVVVGIVAVVAAFLAFLFGWIAGDPSILKLGR